MKKIRDRDYILDKERNYLKVVGDFHPNGFVISYVKHFPSQYGTRIIRRKKYEHNSFVPKSFAILKNLKNRVIFSEKHGGILTCTANKDILKVYSCRKKLQYILKNKDKYKNHAVGRELIKFLDYAEEFLDLSNLGITGSFLIDCYNDKSDIDLVCYGKESYKKIRKLFKFSGFIIPYKDDYAIQLYNRRINYMIPSDFDLFIKQESRKLQGLTQECKIHINCQPLREDEDMFFRNMKFIEVGEISCIVKILDDAQGIFSPAYYKIKVRENSFKFTIQKNSFTVLSYHHGIQIGYLKQICYANFHMDQNYCNKEYYKKVWNSILSHYSLTSPVIDLGDLYRSKILRKLITEYFFQDKKHKKREKIVIDDYGAGNWLYLNEIARVLSLNFGEREIILNGIDFSSQALNFGYLKYKDIIPKNIEVHTIEADILEFLKKREDKSVDCVLCLETLEHLREDRKVIANIMRVLKDNGLFILSVPNKFPFVFSKNWFLYKFFKKSFAERDGAIGHCRRYTSSHFKSHSKQSAEILKVYYYGFFLFDYLDDIINTADKYLSFLVKTILITSKTLVSLEQSVCNFIGVKSSNGFFIVMRKC